MIRDSEQYLVHVHASMRVHVRAYTHTHTYFLFLQKYQFPLPSSFSFCRRSDNFRIMALIYWGPIICQVLFNFQKNFAVYMLSLCYRLVSEKVSTLPKLSLVVGGLRGWDLNPSLPGHAPPTFHTTTSTVYRKVCTKFISFIYWVMRTWSLGLSRCSWFSVL